MWSLNTSFLSGRKTGLHVAVGCSFDGDCFSVVPVLRTLSLHMCLSPSLRGNASSAWGEAVTTVPFTRSRVGRVSVSIFANVQSL